MVFPIGAFNPAAFAQSAKMLYEGISDAVRFVRPSQSNQSASALALAQQAPENFSAAKREGAADRSRSEAKESVVRDIMKRTGRSLGSLFSFDRTTSGSTTETSVSTPRSIAKSNADVNDARLTGEASGPQSARIDVNSATIGEIIAAVTVGFEAETQRGLNDVSGSKLSAASASSVDSFLRTSNENTSLAYDALKREGNQYFGALKEKACAHGGTTSLEGDVDEILHALLGIPREKAESERVTESEAPPTSGADVSRAVNAAPESVCQILAAVVQGVEDGIRNFEASGKAVDNATKNKLLTVAGGRVLGLRLVSPSLLAQPSIGGLSESARKGRIFLSVMVLNAETNTKPSAKNKNYSQYDGAVENFSATMESFSRQLVERGKVLNQPVVQIHQNPETGSSPAQPSTPPPRELQPVSLVNSSDQPSGEFVSVQVVRQGQATGAQQGPGSPTAK